MSILADVFEPEQRDTEKSVLVSVLIPLEDHRESAERSIRAWCAEQTLDRERYEVITVASNTVPKRRLDRIRRLLGERDRLVVTTHSHDVAQVAEAAALARGTFLFFSESHVWPNPDVLERCLDRMEARPDWAALICNLRRVTFNRLGEVEAEMYERDFASGSAELRWRNINDAAFFTRREPYFAAGGFDVGLGHFAEWLLAARYATEGFAVGYAADIEMSHLYPGDLRRDLARHVIRMVAAEARRARSCKRAAIVDWRLALERVPVALFGAWYERVRAAAAVVAARAGLFSAQRSRRDRALAIAFERYVTAVIRRARIRWTAAFLARRRPVLSGELWSAFSDRGDAGAGLYGCERFGNVTFRWSEPAAVVAVDLPPGRYRIHVNTLRPQLAARIGRPEFFLNAKPVEDVEISADGGEFSFSADVADAGGSWLGWVCPASSAPGDGRELGLPLVSILATVGEP